MVNLNEIFVGHRIALEAKDRMIAMLEKNNFNIREAEALKIEKERYIQIFTEQKLQRKDVDNLVNI